MLTNRTLFWMASVRCDFQPHSVGRHWIGGERGGKGGAMRAHQKWLCTIPYFLVIADDQKDEKLSLLL
jgi:hypothetical protein